MPKSKTKAKSNLGLVKLGKFKFDKTLLIVTSLVVTVTAGYLFYKSSHAASNLYCVQFTFSYGSSGHCVSDIQALLNWDVNAGLSVDGQFGPKTQNWVKWIQGLHGLPTNGSVNGATWKVMCAGGSKGPSFSTVLYWENAGCSLYYSGISGGS